MIRNELFTENHACVSYKDVLMYVRIAIHIYNNVCVHQ